MKLEIDTDDTLTVILLTLLFVSFLPLSIFVWIAYMIIKED